MCELDINECADNEQICGSFTCVNLPGDYKCECDFFHSGKRCQKSMLKTNEILYLLSRFSFFFSVSGVGIFVVIISSIVVILIIAFLVLFTIRTCIAYRTSKRVSRYSFHCLVCLFSLIMSVENVNFIYKIHVWQH